MILQVGAHNYGSVEITVPTNFSRKLYNTGDTPTLSTRTMIMGGRVVSKTKCQEVLFDFVASCWPHISVGSPYFRPNCVFVPCTPLLSALESTRPIQLVLATAASWRCVVPEVVPGWVVVVT